MAITSFSGDYRWLSNFHYSPIEVNGWRFTTVEHAYQALKSKEASVWLYVQSLRYPSHARHYGRTIAMRSDFEEKKLKFMEYLLRQKFDRVRHQKLAIMLDNTKPHELIEENDWGDTFWGTYHGCGQNHLGKLLMKIREEVPF